MLPFLCQMLEIPEIVLDLTKPDVAWSDIPLKLVRECTRRDCSPQRCPPPRQGSQDGTVPRGSVRSQRSRWMVSEVALKGENQNALRGLHWLLTLRAAVPTVLKDQTQGVTDLPSFYVPLCIKAHNFHWSWVGEWSGTWECQRKLRGVAATPPECVYVYIFKKKKGEKKTFEVSSQE